MQAIKDWAIFYKEKRLWVYPYNLKEEGWIYWKKLKSNDDYMTVFNSWDWEESNGIKLVVGKKGVRVIEVSTKKLLKKALALLGLDDGYPWIIYSKSGYGIIVDTPGVSIRTKGMSNKSFKQLLLLWDGYYVLPSIGVSRYFYKNQVPQEHPRQIEDDGLLNCIDTLIQI